MPYMAGLAQVRGYKMWVCLICVISPLIMLSQDSKFEEIVSVADAGTDTDQNVFKSDV